MKVEYWNDLGKYLIDASKVVLGIAVIAPMFEVGSEAAATLGTLMVGAVTAAATVAMGIYLKNLKK